MHAFDMHLHTRRHSPDSQINPFSLLRQALTLGLDGVVITEHDFLWTADELEELRAATPSVQVYAGMEVSADEGHFLCYGITKPERLPKGIALKDLCSEVHAQGGVVIAAHPYRWGQDFDTVLASGALLDGLEIMSSNMDSTIRAKAKEAWQQHAKPWAAVGNSDGHELNVVGVCFSAFPEAIRDEADLLEALRAGNVEAREREDIEIQMIEE
jgi:predicted metal-dependent phosphoesterase TrpH